MPKPRRNLQESGRGAGFCEILSKAFRAYTTYDTSLVDREYNTETNYTCQWQYKNAPHKVCAALEHTGCITFQSSARGSGLWCLLSHGPVTNPNPYSITLHTDRITKWVSKNDPSLICPVHPMNSSTTLNSTNRTNVIVSNQQPRRNK